MIAMASGDPVDQQREARWPNRTAAQQPKVQFHVWEEDEDLSDMEGLFGFPAGSTRHIVPATDDDKEENGAEGGAALGV